MSSRSPSLFLTLQEALRLLFFLYAAKDPVKYQRAALRWLARFLAEGEDVSLLKVQLAVAALSELRAGAGGTRRSC